MKLLAHWLSSRIVPQRAPDFAVGDPSDAYLYRWYLIPRNRIFNVYLHWIRKSDDDRALHNHPWQSLSLTLAGSIREHRHDAPSRLITTGQWTYRSANFAHRLEVPPNTFGAWTLFLTGPKIKEWGFLCPDGFKHWRDYTRSDAPGQIGRGCES